MPPELLRAYIDESVALRPRGQQEYLIGAALVADDASDEVRGHLRALALPGQLKLHWKDESETRRRWIVGRIAELAPMTVVVTQMSEAARRTERCRRKCLEVLYHELVAMHVHDAVLEQRSEAQDRSDRAHIVSLQGQGLDRRLRIRHVRGADDPLLWIADVLLGAVNAAARARPEHLDTLRDTILVHLRTAQSL